MIDETKVRDALVSLLEGVAEKARQDARDNNSDIMSVIGTNEGDGNASINLEHVERAIENVERATRTKEGARRMLNAIMVTARVVGRVT